MESLDCPGDGDSRCRVPLDRSQPHQPLIRLAVFFALKKVLRFDVKVVKAREGRNRSSS